MQNTGSLILLWRNQKNLTQQELSKLCGISRPNLSAIEQGARDMTVGTLRRIAAALGVSAGTLVDGTNPVEGALENKKLDRHAIDRVARLASGQNVIASAQEKHLAGELRSIMKYKTNPSSFIAKKNNARLESATALRLKTQLGSVMFEHLLKRVEKNIPRDWKIDE